MLYRFNKNNQVDLQLGKSNMIISGDVIFYSDILTVKPYLQKKEKRVTRYVEMIPGVRHYLPLVYQKSNKPWYDNFINDYSLALTIIFSLLFSLFVILSQNKLSELLIFVSFCSILSLLFLANGIKNLIHNHKNKTLTKKLVEFAKDESNVLIDKANSSDELYIAGLAIYTKEVRQGIFQEYRYSVELVSNNEQEQKENFVTIQSLQKDVVKNILQLEPKASSNV